MSIVGLFTPKRCCIYNEKRRRTIGREKELLVQLGLLIVSERITSREDMDYFMTATAKGLYISDVNNYAPPQINLGTKSGSEFVTF